MIQKSSKYNGPLLWPFTGVTETDENKTVHECLQELDPAVVNVGLGSVGGTQDALAQLYQSVAVDDGYRLRHDPGGPAAAAVAAAAAAADFQPPYFPPPNAVPQPPTGASSTAAVVNFPSGTAGAAPPPRHFSVAANAYGYAAGVQYQQQPAAAQPYHGLLPSSAVDPGDFGAATGGGGAVYGVASPRRATGGGGEFRINCGAATTSAAGLHEVFHASSALPDFTNLENLTFTPVCI